VQLQLEAAPLKLTLMASAPCGRALSPKRRSAHASCPPGAAEKKWNSGGHEACALAALGARESPAARCGGLLFQEVCSMFVVMEMSLVVVEKLVPLEKKIRGHNSSLANQIATASESVALNVAEGRWRQAGDKRRHFEMAAGSASELTMGLRVAQVKGYVSKQDVAEVDQPLDQVRAMLYRLARR
jgi:four helix bundle protein